MIIKLIRSFQGKLLKRRKNNEGYQTLGKVLRNFPLNLHNGHSNSFETHISQTHKCPHSPAWLDLRSKQIRHSPFYSELN